MERDSDTRNFFRRELSTLAQYFIFTLVAGLGTFIWFITPPNGEGEYVSAINVAEAWKMYKPLFYRWLFILTALALVRLVVVFVVKRREGFR